MTGWRLSRSFRRGEDRGASMELAAPPGESSQVSDRDGERPPDEDAGGVESGLVPPGERPAIREVLSTMRRLGDEATSAIGGGGGDG